MKQDTIVNNFVIDVATTNGSGSQSSNNILLKSLFRMGLPVGGKNLFPSNIQGLPTWFTIRVSEKGYTGNSLIIDIKIAMNLGSIYKDIKAVKPNGVFIYNKDLKFDKSKLRDDTLNIAIPFKEVILDITKSTLLKKLLTNIIYVGVLGQLIKMDFDILSKSIVDQFSGKKDLIDSNIKALKAGWDYAKKHINQDILYKIETPKNKELNKNKILIDGNTAAGLGLAYAGCTFAAWYPITPSSSLMESFIKYANQLRVDNKNKKTFAVVQAEDELASIAMVAGAGWAGARAVTATSGPGLSLMAETAGLCYFAEIPSVIWDVQRAGPSTGLPTRTMQCDVSFAVTLSHGDTKHPVLIPGSPKECFEFAQTSLDLAERLQTLVIVLSDLDLGMNPRISNNFKYPSRPIDRGKILKKEDLDNMSEFARYRDTDGDGVAFRTLPGTENDLAAYFTRGTGHDEFSKYTEDNIQFKKTLDRLALKWQTAKTIMPKPIIDDKKNTVAIIAYGSSDFSMQETRDLLKKNYNLSTDYLRLRSVPFNNQVYEFIKNHQSVTVIDQNRDAQMHKLLQTSYPDLANKLFSVCHYDGLSLDADFLVRNILLSNKKPEITKTRDLKNDHANL